jgi:predicted HTH transcriptional regulator
MRHWEQMKQDGNYWCGEFETDETDWRLAELITNIQFACQKYYFGAMAENYFDNKLRDANVNVQRRQKTIEAFNRLPEEFTNEDVMRCFGLTSSSSARKRTSRLLSDRLVEKIREEKGGTQALFRKTGVAIL